MLFVMILNITIDGCSEFHLFMHITYDSKMEMYMMPSSFFLISQLFSKKIPFHELLIVYVTCILMSILVGPGFSGE